MEKLRNQTKNEPIHGLAPAGGSSSLGQEGQQDGGMPSEPPHCGCPDGNKTMEGAAQHKLESWGERPVLVSWRRCCYCWKMPRPPKQREREK